MKSTYKKKKGGQNRSFSLCNFFPRNHRGLSTIFVTVLLIGLTIVAVGIVWRVGNNLIRGKMSNTEACFGNFGKVSINSQYTCYKTASHEFQFSLSIQDIDVESVIVGISSSGESKSYTIPGTYADLRNYTAGTPNTKVILPGRNAGTTYITTSFTAKPDSVKIIPVINGQQCDVSDTLAEIDDCI